MKQNGRSHRPTEPNRVRSALLRDLRSMQTARRWPDGSTMTRVELEALADVIRELELVPS